MFATFTSDFELLKFQRRVVVKCNDNYKKENRCRVLRVPEDQSERPKRLDVRLPRKTWLLIQTTSSCVRNTMRADHTLIKLPGGCT